MEVIAVIACLIIWIATMAICKDWDEGERHD